MEELRMSVQDRVRLDAMHRVERDEQTVVAAASLMGVSVRQARRLWKRFQAQGAAGLVHRLRDRPSNRRLAEELRQRIVKRHQERYADFGPTFACEKLAEEGLSVSPDTLTALLKERQLWQRRRKHKKHRQRRERRASFGSMVQMDGSPHDWFEGRAPPCELMVLIDDATNRTYARFYPAETTVAAFDMFGRWTRRHGLARSVYVDRHSIYRDEDHPEKPTQFGRAMKELGVELILAHSPQPPGQGTRGTAASGVSGPSGQGTALAEHLGPGAGQRPVGEALPAGPEPTLCGGAA
jgi:transposase